jgi:hypothetical protein
MFIQDEALIYKQYDFLYYAITKQNGKMILKQYYFKESYPEIKSLFFVVYEYDSYLFRKANNNNATSLMIQNMDLDYIVPLKSIGSSILLFQYIFNYCIDYKIDIVSIWNQLSIFFRNDLKDELDCYYFIYYLLYQLGVLEIEHNFINRDNLSVLYYKNLILQSLIKMNPNHIVYLNKIINRL